MITITLPPPPIGTVSRRLYEVVPATLDPVTLDVIEEHIEFVAEFPVEPAPEESK